MKRLPFWRLVAVAALLAPVAACTGSPKPAPTNGATKDPSIGTVTSVEAKVRPYAARIYYEKKSGIETFSGTLIADRWVLSAAHAVPDAKSRKPDPKPYEVQLGDPSSFQPTSFRVDRVVVHPKYTRTREPGLATLYDVALFHLTKKPTKVKPLALASAEPKPGAVVTLLGWGCESSPTCPIGSPLLKVMTKEVITDQDCGLSKATEKIVVCVAPNVPGGVNQGDSGGPMLVGPSKKPAVAGVVVSTSGKNAMLVPVTAVRGWIRGVTGV
jgi:secreted trypsin-like serine protease